MPPVQAVSYEFAPHWLSYPLQTVQVGIGLEPQLAVVVVGQKALGMLDPFMTTQRWAADVGLEAQERAMAQYPVPPPSSGHVPAFWPRHFRQLANPVELEYPVEQ